MRSTSLLAASQRVARPTAPANETTRLRLVPSPSARTPFNELDPKAVPTVTPRYRISTDTGHRRARPDATPKINKRHKLSRPEPRADVRIERAMGDWIATGLGRRSSSMVATSLRLHSVGADRTLRHSSRS